MSKIETAAATTTTVDVWLRCCGLINGIDQDIQVRSNFCGKLRIVQMRILQKICHEND
jgi:hypothetical protein